MTFSWTRSVSQIDGHPIFDICIHVADWLLHPSNPADEGVDRLVSRLRERVVPEVPTKSSARLATSNKIESSPRNKQRKRRVAKSSKMVPSPETHRGAFEVTTRSRSPLRAESAPPDAAARQLLLKQEDLLLMKLRVIVAASTCPTLSSTTVPTLSGSSLSVRRYRVGEVELDRKAAGDSGGGAPSFLEGSSAPKKVEKVKLQALNSAEGPWDPRNLRASSDSVVVAPTRLNAQDSEGAPSLAAGGAPPRAASRS